MITETQVTFLPIWLHYSTAAEGAQTTDKNTKPTITRPTLCTFNPMNVVMTTIITKVIITKNEKEFRAFKPASRTVACHDIETTFLAEVVSVSADT